MSKEAEHIEDSNRLPILAETVRRAHAGTMDAAKTAAAYAIEAGTALIEAKALLKHGQWLPWLKEHCHLSERTAQLYMKIVRLGFNAEGLARIGIKATGQAIEARYPDQWSWQYGDESEWRPWLPFSLFLIIECDRSTEWVSEHLDWLKRGGWNSPDEWMCDDGDGCRHAFKMEPIPDETKDGWQAYKRANEARPLRDLKTILAMSADQIRNGCGFADAGSHGAEAGGNVESPE